EQILAWIRCYPLAGVDAAAYRRRLAGRSGRGGTGRRAGFRLQWATVGVRVPPPAPASQPLEKCQISGYKVRSFMQTVETLNEGLKRAFRITIPAKDIDARVDRELKTLAPQGRMPGFRPGKVPANLVRKMH